MTLTPHHTAPSSPTLVLASSNAGKLNEFNNLLTPLGLKVVPQSEFDVPDADETGLSFIENALLKARHASDITGLPALADDSGIVVPSLGGAPGIYSARYAGTRSDADNIALLLKNMTGMDGENRKAHFICALACVRHAKDPDPIVTVERWYGDILTAPTGTQGFGYDPIFWVPEEQASAAELPPETKRALSHRGKATRALLAQLKTTALA